MDTKNEKGSDSDVEEGDAASKELATAADPDLNPGGLTFEEGARMRLLYALKPHAQQVLGRCRCCWWNGSPSRRIQLHASHVCLLSFLSSACTHLILSHSVGRIIGTGIFSTPSSILGSVGSVGASLMLWVLGFVLAFCGLFIWLEFGTMFPRSGGEKVYLEAVYKKPK